MGITAGSYRWGRPGGRDYGSLDELTDVTRRRLCLPAERAGDVSKALLELGIERNRPTDLGSADRDVVTIWWDGRA